ncbi:uncharacterized protein BO96DRAFT_409552 [Aspergillus niger CBS 101883]|uniref:Uncharacterized protein n=1 Tax=Aspergillus niger ATCC 13496 TaxID=1353008 RepID=A0A370BIQ7_ASPNG|nr:uncharacterized protein BO96DRAFT_409552 [Aspergillus niger CBS 101883]PYH59245.1 hypothetical protein BO96DRAFT_409552 [Aspergillus niger CBS 101883]RDH15454.1 hypothetical protein M747DRAFT_138772 [Aspergillus niger ATCC 13496]
MDKQLLLTGSRSAITDRLPLTAYLIAWHFPLTFLFLVAHLYSYPSAPYLSPLVFIWLPARLQLLFTIKWSTVH